MQRTRQSEMVAIIGQQQSQGERPCLSSTSKRQSSWESGNSSTPFVTNSQENVPSKTVAWVIENEFCNNFFINFLKFFFKCVSFMTKFLQFFNSGLEKFLLNLKGEPVIAFISVFNFILPLINVTRGLFDIKITLWKIQHIFQTSLLFFYFLVFFLFIVFFVFLKKIF